MLWQSFIWYSSWYLILLSYNSRAYILNAWCNADSVIGRCSILQLWSCCRPMGILPLSLASGSQKNKILCCCLGMYMYIDFHIVMPNIIIISSSCTTYIYTYTHTWQVHLTYTLYTQRHNKFQRKYLSPAAAKPAVVHSSKLEFVVQYIQSSLSYNAGCFGTGCSSGGVQPECSSGRPEHLRGWRLWHYLLFLLHESRHCVPQWCCSLHIEKVILPSSKFSSSRVWCVHDTQHSKHTKHHMQRSNLHIWRHSNRPTPRYEWHLRWN